MGKSLYETGRLDAPTIRKAKLVLAKFADIARSNGCTDIVAMATCAAREAPNRKELVEHLCDIVRPGDLVITQGAGDVTSIGPSFIKAMKARQQKQA